MAYKCHCSAVKAIYQIDATPLRFNRECDGIDGASLRFNRECDDIFQPGVSSHRERNPRYIGPIGNPSSEGAALVGMSYHNQTH
ncbi:MAG: hypothetical protein NTY15_15460 [Planctomycetota bacterium]|nr:hypothetical protein [Planctomycetota bacterium]